MPETKLKPCPFCGGKVRIHRRIIAGVTTIDCPECKATVSFRGKESVIGTTKA